LLGGKRQGDAEALNSFEAIANRRDPQQMLRVNTATSTMVSDLCGGAHASQRLPAEPGRKPGLTLDMDQATFKTNISSNLRPDFIKGRVAQTTKHEQVPNDYRSSLRKFRGLLGADEALHLGHLATPDRSIHPPPSPQRSKERFDASTVDTQYLEVLPSKIFVMHGTQDLESQEHDVRTHRAQDRMPKSQKPSDWSNRTARRPKQPNDPALDDSIELRGDDADAENGVKQAPPFNSFSLLFGNVSLKGMLKRKLSIGNPMVGGDPVNKQDYYDYCTQRGGLREQLRKAHAGAESGHFRSKDLFRRGRQEPSNADFQIALPSGYLKEIGIGASEKQMPASSVDESKYLATLNLMALDKTSVQ